MQLIKKLRRLQDQKSHKNWVNCETKPIYWLNYIKSTYRTSYA
jgi:hypothetical protein